MKILKFGGTSLKDTRAIKQVANILKNQNLPVIVVCSATAGTTNTLLEMVDLATAGEMEQASQLKKNLEGKHFDIVKTLGLKNHQKLKNELTAYISTLEILLIGVYYLRESTPRVLDAVAAHGELLSTKILAAYLEHCGLPSVWLDIRDVMITNDNFGSAQPTNAELEKRTEEQLKPLLQESKLIVTQGFIGTTENGLTTTLGRGGSDYTAALLGDVVNADAIEIWTDVSGVMTADPRLVKTAFSQRDLSFKEAAELAYFGARVLHPSTILPAVEKSIPVVVKNTLAPDDPGTVITRESKRPSLIKAIAFRSNISVLTIESSRMLMAYGFLERIFDVFSRHKISVDLISTSEISVSLTVDIEFSLDSVIQDLNRFSTVNLIKDRSIISMVGDGIKNSPHFLNQVFNALDGLAIEMITFGASNVNLSLVVSTQNLKRAVNKLHQAFFENNDTGS